MHMPEHRELVCLLTFMRPLHISMRQSLSSRSALVKDMAVSPVAG